jgi:hypothetical protein
MKGFNRLSLTLVPKVRSRRLFNKSRLHPFDRLRHLLRPDHLPSLKHFVKRS